MLLQITTQQKQQGYNEMIYGIIYHREYDFASPSGRGVWEVDVCDYCNSPRHTATFCPKLNNEHD